MEYKSRPLKWLHLLIAAPLKIGLGEANRGCVNKMFQTPQLRICCSGGSVRADSIVVEDLAIQQLFLHPLRLHSFFLAPFTPYPRS